jgi:hypothetical protein
MQMVVGPVLTRKGGFAFDSWTPEEGLSRGYIYNRVEKAHYAHKFEVRSRGTGGVGRPVACSTVDEFVQATT